MASSNVGGVNSINFNIGNGKLANTAKPALTSARAIQGSLKKNSLSAMTKDLIMQYPMFIDSDIDTDSAIVVVKGQEKQYAALQLALWSADTAFGVDPTSTGGVRDFVKKYHNNASSPDLISYSGNLVRNVSAYKGEYAPITESAEIIGADEIHKTLAKQALDSLWETVEDRVTMESVNSLYQPAKGYVKKINKIARALEAPTVVDTTSDTTSDAPPVKAPRTFRERYNNVSDNGYKATVYQGRTDEESKADRGSLKNAEVLKNDKLSSLEPTLLNVHFFVRDPKGGGRVQDAVIGVKVMPRSISSNAMAANIIAAIQGSHTAFQFVKWTRGETKLIRDAIFNVSQIKKDALTKDRFDRYFGAMRKRKNNFKTFKFGDATVNPFTTLVVSKTTVESIKRSAGYDIEDEKMAQRLIDSLFLLGIIIVDVNTGIVSTMLDDWSNYAETTLKAIKGSSSKDNDFVSDFKEVMKLSGRAAY